MIAADPPAPLARSPRARVLLLALSLVVVAATAAALVIVFHTNAGPPGSFEFGARFYVRLGGVILGPAILAWTICWRTRGHAWTWAAIACISCSAMLALMVVVYTALYFRPLIGHEPYDRAVRAVARELKSNAAMLGEDRVKRLRSLRPRIQSANGDTVALLAAVRDGDELIAELELEVQRIRGWPDFVLRAFRNEGVSDRRGEEYLRQVTPSLDLEDFVRADNELIESIRTVQNWAQNAMPSSPQP